MILVAKLMIKFDSLLKRLSKLMKMKVKDKLFLYCQKIYKHPLN
jgi:hypothetical protein